jgi:hypothetical protein
MAEARIQMKVPTFVASAANANRARVLLCHVLSLVMTAWSVYAVCKFWSFDAHAWPQWMYASPVSTSSLPPSGPCVLCADLHSPPLQQLSILQTFLSLIACIPVVSGVRALLPSSRRGCRDSRTARPVYPTIYSFRRPLSCMQHMVLC